MENNILPILLFVFGMMFILISAFEYFFPSKNRYQKGYRTKRSLFTQESWDFAQKYYAKMLFRCALLFIILAFLSVFMKISARAGAILFVVFLFASAFFIYFKTENALKKNF